MALWYEDEGVMARLNQCWLQLCEFIFDTFFGVQKNAVATSHGAQGNTIEFTYGLQWRVLQEQQDVQWRKIALVFSHALYFLVFANLWFVKYARNVNLGGKRVWHSKQCCFEVNTRSEYIVASWFCLSVFIVGANARNERLKGEEIELQTVDREFWQEHLKRN